MNPTVLKAELDAIRRISEAMLSALEEVAAQQFGEMLQPARVCLSRQVLSYEEAVATRILEVACDITGATAGAYLSYNARSATLGVVSTFGSDEGLAADLKEWLQTTVERESGPVGLMAKTRKPVYITDVAGEPGWRPFDDRLRSVYLAPLHHGSKLFGVYVLFSEGPDGFSRERRVFARALTFSISIAMENTLLFSEVQRAYEKLNQAQQQLLQAQKMEAIGKLAGGVAHDLNNHLTVIRGCVDLALPLTGRNSPCREPLLQIRAAAEKASTLTQQLMLFARKQPQHRIPVNLNRTILDFHKMMGRLIREDIEVSLELSPNLWTIHADPSNLDQVLANLVINAIDAMPRGGHLTIKTKNVVVDNEHCTRCSPAEGRPGPHVCLEVSDTGEGIDVSLLPHLFEPFFTTKPAGKGTGLGLSVTYGIVKAHDGWITVESQVGKGSTFRVFLPAMPADEGLPDRNEREPANVGSFLGRGQRILLVEDEPEVRLLTEKMLTNHGYNVSSFGTASEALAAFKQEEGRFDLVVSDVVLSDGRGPDLLLKLKSLNPSVQVLLVTGYGGDKEDWDLIRKEGLPFLMKPYTMTQLVQQVYDAFSRRGSPAS